jgi:anti-sigma B factor antagonist
MKPIRPRISIQYADNATVITFTDEKILEQNDVEALADSVMSVIDHGERMNLILDFCNVQFLSSSVLGLLIRISKKIYEQNGQLKLCNISSRIYEVFKITRLTKVFDIHKDVAEAVDSLSASK